MPGLPCARFRRRACRHEDVKPYCGHWQCRYRQRSSWYRDRAYILQRPRPSLAVPHTRPPGKKETAWQPERHVRNDLWMLKFHVSPTSLLVGRLSLENALNGTFAYYHAHITASKKPIFSMGADKMANLGGCAGMQAPSSQPSTNRCASVAMSPFPQLLHKLYSRLRCLRLWACRRRCAPPSTQKQ